MSLLNDVFWTSALKRFATRTVVGPDDARIDMAVGTVVVVRLDDTLRAQNAVGGLGPPVVGRCGGGI